MNRTNQDDENWNGNKSNRLFGNLRDSIYIALSPDSDEYPDTVPLHFSYRELIRYASFSGLCCFVSFFVIRIINTLVLSLFLRFNDIAHTYRLLEVNYHNSSASNWSEGKLLFIHLTPYVVFAMLGMFMPGWVRKSRSWYVHLAITWMSFNMVIFVISELVYGLFDYSGLGVPLEWFSPNIYVAIAEVLILSFLLLTGIVRFGWFFLQSAPHLDFGMDYRVVRSWFTYALLIPFVVCFVAIPFIVTMNQYLNLLITLVVSFVAIVIVFGTITKVYVVGINDEQPHTVPAYVWLIVFAVIMTGLLFIKDSRLILYS